MGNIRHIIITIGISILIIVGIGGWIEYKNQNTENALLTNEETLEGPLTAEELETANPDISNTMNRIATFNTNKGIIKIELFEDQMPITTGNFIKLAEEGFYDGTKFHRVIKDFMIQGGDPNTKGDDTAIYGQGGPGYTIQDEFVEGELLTNVRGTIAMANTGQPNSGGSQFFINTADNKPLDWNDTIAPQSNHPVFGRVIEGMDVVDTIENVKTAGSPTDRPLEPVIIESITIGAE